MRTGLGVPVSGSLRVEKSKSLLGIEVRQNFPDS